MKNYDDYLEGEFPEDDDDIMEAYLIEEEDDLTMIMLPQWEFDLETELERYYKVLKQCRNKEQLISVLRQFYSHVATASVLEHEIRLLQDRAKELEFSVSLLRQQFD